MNTPRYIILHREGSNVLDFSSRQWNLRSILRALEDGERFTEEYLKHILGDIPPSMPPTHIMIYRPGHDTHGMEIEFSEFLKRL